MRIFLLVLMIMFFNNSSAFDVYSEDILKMGVTEDDLRREAEKEYFGKINKAGALEKKVLERKESKYGVNSVETLKLLEALAWMSMENQGFEEAGIYYQRVINVRKSSLPLSDDNMTELAVAYFMLGDSYLYLSDYENAIINYDESLSFASDHGNRGDTLSRKGIAYEGLKEHENALEVYLEALNEYDKAKAFNPQNSDLIDKRVLIAYKRLSELYHKLEDNRKVKEYLDLIKDLKAQRKAEEVLR